MTPKIEKLVATIRKAESDCLAEVQKEMAKAARREGIDRMDFLLTTTLYRDGEEVESEAIEAIENFYLEEISQHGFEDMWTDADGWIGEKS